MIRRIFILSLLLSLNQAKSANFDLRFRSEVPHQDPGLDDGLRFKIALKPRSLNVPTISSQAGSLESFNHQEDPFKGYPAYLWRSMAHVFRQPVDWYQRDWLLAAGILTAVKLSFSADDQVTDWVQFTRTPGSRTFGKEIGKFGMEYGWATLAGFYLAGRLGGSKKAQTVARDGLTANLIAAGIITPALKEITGRSRPILGEGANAFAPFSGKHSFPSGHTTQAFAIASTIAAHYPRDRWVQISSFGIATMVGLSRMESDAHFVSDVLAGAAIGTFVGFEVVNRGKQKSSVKWEPLLAPNRVGIRLRFLNQ